MHESLSQQDIFNQQTALAALLAGEAASAFNSALSHSRLSGGRQQAKTIMQMGGERGKTNRRGVSSDAARKKRQEMASLTGEDQVDISDEKSRYRAQLKQRQEQEKELERQKENKAKGLDERGMLRDVTAESMEKARAQAAAAVTTKLDGGDWDDLYTREELEDDDECEDMGVIQYTKGAGELTLQVTNDTPFFLPYTCYMVPEDEGAFELKPNKGQMDKGRKQKPVVIKARGRMISGKSEATIVFETEEFVKYWTVVL